VEATAGRDVVPTLVLCCAKDTRHLLPPALELLVGRGFQVEVVSGLEQRDDAVLVTVQRQRDALYILFESAELGPALVDRTKAKLAGAGVPRQRIASMPLDWRGPLDVVKKVEAMGIAPPPTVRRPTAVSLPAPAPAPAPAASIPPPLPRATPATGVAAIGRAVAKDPLHSGSVPVLDGSDDGDFVDFRHARRRLLVGGCAVLGSLAVILGIVAIASDDEPEAETPKSALVAAPEHSPFVAAWTWWRKSSGAQAEVVEAPSSGQVASATPVPVAAVPTPVAPVAVEPVPPAVVPSPTAPVAATPAVPPAMAVAPVDAKPAAAVVPGEEPKIDVAVEEVAEIDEAEMQAIYAGLIAQKFRALDILLISPEPRKKVRKKWTKSPARMTWGQAAAYCDKLEIGGVSDWRLPRVGELGSITAGSLVADGKFWSQTEGDTFGKSRVVWNTQTSKMGSAPVRWKGGRVVCVRTMARPPEVPSDAAE
jgi:hypothetical protein